MECLYKVKEKNTFEEMKKFNWALIKRKKSFWICWIISEVILLAWAGLCFYGGLPDAGFFSLVFAVCLPFFDVWYRNRRLRKNFESAAAFRDTDSHYEFYDTYFLDIDTHGMNRVEYRELFGILETKTNFYLMLGDYMGYLLRKDNFPEGLAEFLRQLDVKKL